MKALQWFAAHEPVCWFDNSAPSHCFRAKLIKRGLIEVISDNRPVHMTTYRLTDFGRMIVEKGTVL